MTPLERDGGLELRSARSPETVVLKTSDGAAFSLSTNLLGLARLSTAWLVDHVPRDSGRADPYRKLP
jgi:hypothetical protein